MFFQRMFKNKAARNTPLLHRHPGPERTDVQGTKVAIVVPADFAVWTFHRGLIRSLQERGLDVTVVGPAGDYVEAIRQLGTKYRTVELDRFFNLRKDVQLLWSLYHIFREEQFAIVHNHTIKPNVFGTLAARLAGVPTILGSVRGRGSLFTEVPGLKRKLLKRAAMALYTLAFSFIDRVQFLNGDDLDFFVSSRMLSPRKATLIKSSGVNLGEYSTDQVDAQRRAALRAELELDADTPIVTMVSRAYWSKGVREFVTAAQHIGANHRVRFLLVGSVESGPDAVPQEYLQQHLSETFRWLGYRKDVRDLLALSAIVVLPSYYPEGVPRSMLEAMAMSKPIVTTDSIGCREVVEHCRNGFMIPIKDARALTTAVDYLLRDPELRARMGAYSRAKVAREFDEQVVANKVLTDLYGFASRSASGGALQYVSSTA